MDVDRLKSDELKNLSLLDFYDKILFYF